MESRDTELKETRRGRERKRESSSCSFPHRRLQSSPPSPSVKFTLEAPLPSTNEYAGAPLLLWTSKGRELAVGVAGEKGASSRAY